MLATTMSGRTFAVNINCDEAILKKKIYDISPIICMVMVILIIAPFLNFEAVYLIVSLDDLIVLSLYQAFLVRDSPANRQDNGYRLSDQRLWKFSHCDFAIVL
jgi:hypothetical protein